MSAVKKESEYGSKGVRKILAGAMKTAPVSRPHYRIVITDLDTTPEDVLHPQYWAHVAETFTRDTWGFAIIELIWEDGSKYMEVMVVSSGQNFAKVKELRFIDLSGQEEDGEYTEQNPDFEVKHRGGAKWSVIRKADNEVLIDKLSSKIEADKWLDDHLKAMKS